MLTITPHIFLFSLLFHSGNQYCAGLICPHSESSSTLSGILICMHCLDNSDNNKECTKRCSARFVAIYLLHWKLFPTCTLTWQMCVTWINHVSHNSSGLWCKGTVKLLTLSQLKSHLFSVCSWTEAVHRWRDGSEPESLEETLMTSSRKWHIQKSENPSPYRDLNLYSINRGRQGKQTC